MRGAKHLNCGQGQIRDAVSIRERPAEADDRAVPGHCEGDLLAGSANTHIATLVERHSRFVMLVAVDGKDTRSVTKALSTHTGRLPEHLRSSFTWDRGMEMAEHVQFTIATDLSQRSQRQLDAIATNLNTRPRETLQIKTPTGTLNAVLR